ncbi:hypothetical protein UFOVP616_39 [uncultured Caudovirales phage]|uniref:Uncharacterized protein n=1 Tax=uncultured Caudovirales phage TaxID=2100421 RepID=A0A6J5NBN5_9CAUD|nr:hypothetical protein UFOVP616_39 [uncultured Caudovirales phage]
MSKDKRFTQNEAFIVDVSGNQLLLPVNQTTFDFIKLIASSPAYSSMYTSTTGTVYYKYGNIEIKLASVNVFHDTDAERQYEAIRKWDQDCIDEKELSKLEKS